MLCEASSSGCVATSTPVLLISTTTTSLVLETTIGLLLRVNVKCFMWGDGGSFFVGEELGIIPLDLRHNIIEGRKGKICKGALYHRCDRVIFST